MTKALHDSLLSPIADYYTDKLNTHGETPRGVDWNGEESQFLRFSQLCKIIGIASDFSVNDLGCGYGAMYDYLLKTYNKVTYNGYDVSTAMIEAAMQRHPGAASARYVVSDKPDVIADYGIASGIFNVRLGHKDADWLKYIEKTLAILHETSSKGFAINCLTSYSDEDKKRPDLFYADPCYLFDYCKRRFSRNVSLLHDYNLYEFTLLVRKA